MNLFVIASIVTLLSVILTGLADAEPIAGVDIGAQYEARVRAGIEANRKSGARIRVIDKSGKQMVGAKVEIEQTSHDFLFGCAFPAWSSIPANMEEDGWANWTKYFTRLFNYTTSENSLKWKPLEPEKGKYRWEPVDFMVGFCKEHNIKIKGHTLVWPWDKQGVPDWILDYTPEQVSAAVKHRIDTVVGKYKHEIPVWDVVNEPIHLNWFDEHWNKDYAVDSFKWTREADADALLAINDYSGFKGAVDRFVPYVQNLLSKGAPIDAIGEQAHDHPYWYTPDEMFNTLDKMASTGLDIHLTEFTYPSDGAEIKGGFMQGNWDEEKQAEFYRYFFTLSFSHSKVEAITLWAMWDGRTWLKQGGIIREDWTPKPAYQALDDLINNKWKTRFESRSDTNGEVRFRGFHGDYRVTVITPKGVKKTSAFRLTKGQDNQIEVLID